ncbi:3-hydroxyisobutyryl-CoA hydrolase [Neophaeococcomyces mojaviensis]|uniref:3-hydroxyisobutyryl-CoA hydrolase n=1 Tax=Neophaeococcomyces mojaviensis TaxID=3383035 RepID=A0ACC3AA28_9EURO|nr:3-hydroxyisobutyryl-CoA hydrolase [Knufia sp. JES_112]
MSSTAPRYLEMPKEQPGDEADDVLFNSLYGVRTVELNRPKKLNSLNASMARKIMPRLREWEKSQMANVIILTGAGEKALCAGGDVAELAKQNGSKEGQQKSTDFFALEYALDHLIATYSKPYISIMDGITMGGGVGLSVHAPFRIATEKTTFAMPETTIGFFPDVGGSFFLSRLDGEVGTYLALTSERLMGVQAMYAGIATHYLDSSVLQPLTTRLSELNFRDHANIRERNDLINSTIAEFTTELPSPASYEKAKNGDISGDLREAIDRCFHFNTIDEILEALRAESQGEGRIAEWAQATVKTIAKRSPTSLKVTLKQLRLGKRWTISEAFTREHQMAARFMEHPDFTEGVSALLINKPPTKPNWKPATLDEVSNEDVDSFFALPEGIRPLELLESLPGSRRDYSDYPHAAYALPRESLIEAVVRNVGQKGEKAVIKEVLSQCGDKVGVREKVQDVLKRKTERQGDAVVWKRQQRASL